MRQLVAGSAALLLALTLGPAAVSAPEAGSAPRGPVPVRPSDLPVGEPPQVPVLDAVTRTLHLPGGITVPVDVRGTELDPPAVFEVAGGYLVSGYVGRRRGDVRTVLVQVDGSARELGSPRPYEVVMVAADGRSYLAQRSTRIVGRSGYTAFRRFRVADGRPLGRALVLPGRRETAAPLLVTPQRVLMTAMRTPYPAQDYRTRWWSTRTGRSTPLPRAPRQTPYPLGRAASLTAGIATSDLERRQEVRDLRTGRLLWRVGRPGSDWTRESGVAVSPDGRHLLTVDDAGTMNGYDPDLVMRLRVRDARTGALLADFGGFFDNRSAGAPPNVKLTWETSDAFLAVGDDEIADKDDEAADVAPVGRESLVRCRVSTGACETAPLAGAPQTGGLSLLTRRSG